MTPTVWWKLEKWEGGRLAPIRPTFNHRQSFAALNPQVVQAGPRDMRMYYHSFDQAKGRYVVGLATSPDGFK